MDGQELARLSRLVRGDVVRMTACRATPLAKALSAVDLLVTLYWTIMTLDVARPLAPLRDRLVMADDDLVTAYYATLARRGFFPRQNLWSWGRLGSMLQGLADDRHTLGVDGPGGRPELGLALASGMAMGYAQGSERVFCLVGEAALASGAFWQTAAAIGHGLLTAPELLVLVHDGTICPETRMASLGWKTARLDGHDFVGMRQALARRTDHAAWVRILECHAGQGVSFLQGHVPSEIIGLSQLDQERALSEIDAEAIEAEEELPWTF